MKKTHVIFDIDDTLTNSYAINQQLFVDTFTAHDPAVDIDYLRDLHYHNRGTSMKAQFVAAVEHLKLELDAEELVKENEQIQITNIDKFDNMKVFSGIPELLAHLKQKGSLISICTNRQTGSQMKILESNGIVDFFSDIISCKDAGHEKPDPYCLEMLMKKYNEPKETYIFFGDSKTDRDFAINAGIDFVIIDHYLNDKKFYQMIVESMI